jgi:hypothetical protein
MAPRGKIGLTQAQTTALAEWARNNAFVSELRVFGPAEQKGARERTATLTNQLVGFLPGDVSAELFNCAFGDESDGSPLKLGSYSLRPR